MGKTRLFRYNKRILDTQTPITPPAPGLREPTVLLSWTAPSHHNHEHSPRWYMIAGSLVLIVAAYGILSGAWTVTLVSLLLGGTYFLVRNESMPMRKMQIEIDGVQFDDTFTPWDQCKDFWIIQTPLYTELRLARKTRIGGDIRIQTGDIDPTLIRTTLSQFLPLRADQKEHIFDVIIRLCKL